MAQRRACESDIAGHLDRDLKFLGSPADLPLLLVSQSKKPGRDFPRVHDWRQFSKDLPESGLPSDPPKETSFYESSPVFERPRATHPASTRQRCA